MPTAPEALSRSPAGRDANYVGFASGPPRNDALRGAHRPTGHGPNVLPHAALPPGSCGDGGKVAGVGDGGNVNQMRTSFAGPTNRL
jgi:hypothetical protein